jgi:hypothetical protein
LVRTLRIAWTIAAAVVATVAALACQAVAYGLFLRASPILLLVFAVGGGMLHRLLARSATRTLRFTDRGVSLACLTPLGRREEHLPPGSVTTVWLRELADAEGYSTVACGRCEVWFRLADGRELPISGAISAGAARTLSRRLRAAAKLG